LVYPEGVMYGKVTKGDVAAIIEEHLLGDKPIERLKVPDFIWS
jgi:(2Fe-2S) ferredoxin